MPQTADDGSTPRLGVLVLGASQFPNYPPSRRLDNESFARSSAAFRELMAAPDTSLLGEPAILDLFDSPDEPAAIIRKIRKFLEKHRTLTDVVIYYCGHGDFLANSSKTYVLMLRATEPDNEAFTALPPRQMRVALDVQLATKRVFLILDCCFAGKAATEWQADGIGHVVEDQLFQAFPKRGTALLAASSKGEPALAPAGQGLTMFTGAFVDVVSRGIEGERKQLSFRDVFHDTRAKILESHGPGAAIPVIHAPQQPEGDISFDPFFLNKGFTLPAEPEASVAERENFELALADLRRSTSQPRMRAAAIENMAELLTETRSGSLRADIVSTIENARDTDNSNMVRSKAREVLEGLGASGPADLAVAPPIRDRAGEKKPPKPPNLADLAAATAKLTESMPIRAVADAMRDLRSGKTPPWLKKSMPMAVEIFRKAAAAGSPYEMYALGRRYETGDGLTKDVAEAEKWYEKAAALGNEQAVGALRRLQKE